MFTYQNNVSSNQSGLGTFEREKKCCSETTFLILRCCFIGLVLTGMTILNISSNAITEMNPNAPACLIDHGFEATESLNEWFLEDTYRADVLLVVAAAILDITLLTTFFDWALHETSLQYVVTLIIFYGFRFLL